jgi:hypothetical protein
MGTMSLLMPDVSRASYVHDAFGPERLESTMITSISSLATNEHVADLHRVAERRRSIPSAWEPNGSAPAKAPAVALRLAGADEGHLVRDLAGLDDALPLEGEALLALVDGEAVAALSLRDRRVVANPFVRTDAAVALLRLRAQHVSGRRARGRWPRILRPRFA